MESRSAAHPVALSALVQTPLAPEHSARLLEHIRSRRWFRGKARPARGLELLDVVPLSAAGRELALCIVRVTYASDDADEIYAVPLASSADGTPAGAALFPLQGGVVYDPTGDDGLSLELLALFMREHTPGSTGRILARPSPELQARAAPGHARFAPRVPNGEQSNTSVFFGEEFMLKLFRQLEAGENPDVELVEFLWAHGYHHVPEPLGDVHYESPGLRATLGIAQRFVPSEGSAWEVTLEILQRSLALARTLDAEQVLSSIPTGDLLESTAEAPSEREGFLGAYAPFATLLGERTAELHRALASDATSEAFRPEPFTAEYSAELANAARERLRKAYELLERQRTSLPAELQASAARALDAQAVLVRTLDRLSSVTIHAQRIRRHGDYHLGQVLYGASDFTILDFEGEPAQPLPQRRRKGSALYDVCGMLRSFHYAATVALQNEPPEERGHLARWSDAWYRWISAQFLCAYLVRAQKGGVQPVFLPAAPEELRALLQLHLIDKCSYELSYELNNRPAWVGVPLAGLTSLADSSRLSVLT